MARAHIRRRAGRALVAVQILGLLVTAVGIAPTPSLAAVAAVAPNVPTNVAPPNGATGVSIDPTLQVDVSDTDGGPVTTSFYGRSLAPVAAEDFTIVEIPDTQHYVDDPSRTATFNQQTQWIVANEDDLNIAFVTHVGDITQNYDTAEIEFVRADSAMDILDNAGIPNNIAPGNHDFSTPGAVTSNYFDEYFPPSRYDLPANPWYGGWLGEEAWPDPAPEQGQLRAVHGRRHRLPDHPPRDRHADLRRPVGERDHRSLSRPPGDHQHPRVPEPVQRPRHVDHHGSSQWAVGGPGLDAAHRTELQRLHGRSTVTTTARAD